MDTSDPGIQFDDHGRCNRCREYESVHAQHVPSPETRKRQLAELVTHIRTEGRKKEYDCVIGVSGGVDSSYVAYVTKKLGLRPLAVHLDNGWDTELAVCNIERCLKTLEIDLDTHVLDWDEFRDLQLAFLKASTPDSEIPTDHAISALMMKTAARIGVRYVISGSNVATEGLFVPTWSRGHFDWKYIKSIHRRHGSVRLKKFIHFSVAELAWTRYVRRQRQVYILNYLDYNKNQAMQVIQCELGWKPYGSKHHESIYTRFFQSYILPRKFGFDKRRMHLSTLIMSGQISRDQAIAEMQKPICSPDLLVEDKRYVCKKLGLSEAEFEAIMALPPRTFWDYPSYEKTLIVRAGRAMRRACQQQPEALSTGKWQPRPVHDR
jgi:N-acetyl sugar amidotransferase